MTSLIRHIVADLSPTTDAGTDDELLARYAACRDGQAFEQLVRRYERLVIACCRRVLGSHHDAEDAAQVVFLALSKQAGRIGKGRLVGWLHTVARRVSRRAARHRSRKLPTVGPFARGTTGEGAQQDFLVGRVLDEELARLPDMLRQVALLCLVGNLTHADAARRLGKPVGSVSVWVSRAKKQLADRLTGRNVYPVVLAAPTVVASPRFTEAAMRHSVAFARGTCSDVPRHLVALANKELRAVALSKWRSISAIVIAAGAGVLGLTLVGRPTSSPDTRGNAPLVAARVEPPSPAVEALTREQAPPPRVSDRVLHQVPLQDSPQSVVVRVGDRIELNYAYTVAPKQLAPSLDVRRSSTKLSIVRMTNAPNNPPDGTGTVRAVISADKVGITKVYVTPVGASPLKTTVLSVQVLNKT